MRNEHSRYLVLVAVLKKTIHEIHEITRMTFSVISCGLVDRFPLVATETALSFVVNFQFLYFTGEADAFAAGEAAGGGGEAIGCLATVPP